MIDITQAQANQTTRSGVNEDWQVTLHGELIYTLPAHFSVQETFLVRNAVEVMMKMAVDGAVAKERKVALDREQRIVSTGDAQLDGLKRENLRISAALEQLQQQLGEVA